MSATIDNLIAFKIISMLVTKFEKTDAYKLGIIDSHGKQLRKIKDFTTSEERNAYTALHRLVFNLKKLLAKLPGGKSTLASIVAAYWLIKESNGRNISEEELLEAIDLVETKRITLVEEYIDVVKYLEQCDEETSIVNATGSATSTDIPVIKPKKKKTLQMFRRKDIQNAQV